MVRSYLLPTPVGVGVGTFRCFHDRRVMEYREIVSQVRPNQPQCGLLSVSRTGKSCVILKAIRTGVGWVWLARPHTLTPCESLATRDYTTHFLYLRKWVRLARSDVVVVAAPRTAVPRGKSNTIICNLSDKRARGSLVPRLPRSGTRTLKLCRRSGAGEPENYAGNEARAAPNKSQQGLTLFHGYTNKSSRRNLYALIKVISL